MEEIDGWGSYLQWGVAYETMNVDSVMICTCTS